MSRFLLSFLVLSVSTLALASEHALEFGRLYPGNGQSYRIENFGNMNLRIRVKGDLSVLVMDPTPKPIGVARAAGDTDLVLSGPGIYRVVPKVSVDGSFVVQCLSNCGGPAVPAGTVLQQMQKSGKLDLLIQSLAENLKTQILDETLRAGLVAKIRGLAKNQDWSKIHRALAVKLSDVSKLQGLLSGYGDVKKESRKPVVIRGSVRDVLACREQPLSAPAPVAQGLEEVSYGHAVNLAMTDCERSQSDSLAQALTSLAEDNGSELIGDKGEKLRSPEDLIRYLKQTGHVVRTRQERTFANLLSFQVRTANGTWIDSVWPLWVELPYTVGGSPVQIPLGHSHYAWLIEGPVVNARVMFYLGLSGAGFWGQTDRRPVWTGWRYGSGVDPVLAARTATQYLRLNRLELAQFKQGLRNDGYGLFGVCNDSTSFLQQILEPGPYPYPRLRAASRTTDDVLKSLMKDSAARGWSFTETELIGFARGTYGDALGNDKAGDLSRVLNMLPDTPEALNTHDLRLIQDINAIKSGG